MIDNKVEEVGMEGRVHSPSFEVDLPEKLIAPNGEVFFYDDEKHQFVSLSGHYLDVIKESANEVTILNEYTKSGMTCQCCYPEEY